MPRKRVVRLTDHPDMTLAVYCGHKTTTQQYAVTWGSVKRTSCKSGGILTSDS